MMTALKTHSSEPEVSVPKTILAIATANQPFKASPSKVNKAAFLLPVRNTLVAPGFFDP